MNNKTLIFVSIILALLVAALFTANLTDKRMFDGNVMGNRTHMGDSAMNGSHMELMQQMFVESERDFIENMIPHHEEAIRTAHEVLERGATTDPIRQLMENIVEAQTQEVNDMKEWYEVWYGTPYEDSNEYMHMMRDLADLSGEDLDRAFLEDMIVHHMGAIMMARSVQPYIEHSEISNLTQNIITTQSAEIVDMRSMLQSL